MPTLAWGQHLFKKWLRTTALLRTDFLSKYSLVVVYATASTLCVHHNTHCIHKNDVTALECGTFLKKGHSLLLPAVSDTTQWLGGLLS